MPRYLLWINNAVEYSMMRNSWKYNYMQWLVCRHWCFALIVFVNSNSGTWYLNWRRSHSEPHRWINVLARRNFGLSGVIKYYEYIPWTFTVLFLMRIENLRLKFIEDTTKWLDLFNYVSWRYYEISKHFTKSFFLFTYH